MALPRLIGIGSFLLAAITLLRPRGGWGRLGLFIPKLFVGTFIVFPGIFGVLAALLGWLLHEDYFTLAFGLAAAVIAIRHIFRIFRNSLTVSRQIAVQFPNKSSGQTASMLTFPWIGYWKLPPDVVWQRDISIGSQPGINPPLLADLWRPTEPSLRSYLGLIYLHGSGWHYADKDFGTRQFFRHLANQGHVILDLAYTLAPKADLFNMVGDVKRGIVWMKEHSEELGIDPNRVVLMGGSAGGQLALLAAYTPNDARFDPPDVHGDTSVSAVISYYGPADLREHYNRFCELPGLTRKSSGESIFMRYLEKRFGFEPLPVHDLLPAFLGGTPEEVTELYDLGSPLSHVRRDCPPTLLLQGTHDFSGAAPQVRNLYNTLLNAGGTAYLLELPEAEHGFDLYKPQWSPAAQAATYSTERFLAGLI